MSSVFGSANSRKYQNIALFIIFIGFSIAWAGLFVLTGPRIVTPNYSYLVILHVAGGLLGILPWATVSSKTPGAKNALRFLIVSIIAGFVLYLITSEFRIQMLLSIGFVIGTGITAGGAVFQFSSGKSILIVLVWVGILAIYTAYSIAVWETLQGTLDSLTVGGWLILTLSVFALHRSFIIERREWFKRS